MHHCASDWPRCRYTKSRLGSCVPCHEIRYLAPRLPDCPPTLPRTSRRRPKNSKARSDGMVGAPVVLNIAAAIHPYALRRHQLDRARPLAPPGFFPSCWNSICRESPQWGFRPNNAGPTMRPRLQVRRRPTQELMQTLGLQARARILSRSNRAVDRSTKHRANSRAPSRSEPAPTIRALRAVAWPSPPVRRTREFIAPRHYVPRGGKPAPGIFRSRDTNAVTTSPKEKAA